MELKIQKIRKCTNTDDEIMNNYMSYPYTLRFT